MRDLLRLVDQSVWANLGWVDLVYAEPDPEVRPRELLGHLMVGERRGSSGSTASRRPRRCSRYWTRMS